MTTTYDQLRKTVLAEVTRQAGKTPLAGPPITPPKALGLFLTEALANRNMSRAAFADALDMERPLADAILDGILPASELNNDLLAEVAGVIGYDANLLRILLGREPHKPDTAHQG
jgi:hypothetical protein